MQVEETVSKIRIGLGLIHQVIAAQANASVSYISKVESYKLHFRNYRSENFIHRLTEVLEADEDELLLLAAKVPAAMRIRPRPALFRRITMMANGALDALESALRSSE